MSALPASTFVSPVTLLRLGRVSNLPTVWTNVAAATVLAGGALTSTTTLLAISAMTLFYVAGMYLNDAFDREWDARERPTRPIPAGEIKAWMVFAVGFGMLGLGLALMPLGDPRVAAAGTALAGAIILYDWWHKGNPLSPLLMGACRVLVYVVAAAMAAQALPPMLLIAGTAMLAHVAGLTYAAKQESLDRLGSQWPLVLLAIPLLLTLPMLWSGLVPALAWLALATVDVLAVQRMRRLGRSGVPWAVANLIAAISLVDAVLVADRFPAVALLCASGYVVTLMLQRYIDGT
jgi:4-hydroxybenzoate polyprenyltransferase